MHKHNVLIALNISLCEMVVIADQVASSSNLQPPSALRRVVLGVHLPEELRNTPNIELMDSHFARALELLNEADSVHQVDYTIFKIGAVVTADNSALASSSSGGAHQQQPPSYRILFAGEPLNKISNDSADLSHLLKVKNSLSAFPQRR